MDSPKEISSKLKRPVASCIVAFLFLFIVITTPIVVLSSYYESTKQDIAKNISTSTSHQEVLTYLEKWQNYVISGLFVIDTASCLMVSLMYYRAQVQKKEIESVAELKQLELDKLIAIEKERKTFADKQHEISFRLQLAHSNAQNLTNTISGVNHEVAPWLGIIRNVANMLSQYMISDKTHVDKSPDFIKTKVYEIEKAAEQCIYIVENLSKNIKYLQRYDISKTNIGETINAMISTALLNSSIRKNIRASQIQVDFKSLNFICTHSPMFVQQILLNFVNNAIDHNSHMKDTLDIKIYGNYLTKTIYVVDNGKGIPDKEIQHIFTPNFTTKDDTTMPHGLGLSMSMDYAVSMGAFIDVASVVGSYTRFSIEFEVPDIETRSNSGSSIYRSLEKL